MFSKKEIGWIFVAILLMGFVIGWSNKMSYSLSVFLIALIIILVNVLAKKIAASHYSLKINHKIWHIQYLWFSKKDKLKKPFPIGLIIPFLLSFLSMGLIKVFALLQFDYENNYKKRALKRRGMYRHSEINESDLAFTSAWGFWSLIALAIISTLINQPEISKYAVYYGLWNLLPLSNLDGSKLFFGSPVNWLLLVIIYIISVVLVVL
jgi:hypothetical protein